MAKDSSSKNFSVDQKTLFSMLSATQPICAKRTTLDATTSILFQVGHREIVLKSTDLEISLQTNCTLSESSITETTTFLVPGKRMFEVIKEFDGTVNCTLKNHQLLLKAGNVTMQLNIQDAQEFPPFPERIENLMHLDRAAVAKMLESVSFLIQQNNTNSALNGLFLEITDSELRMTATDGHCLAQAKTARYHLQDQRSWLIPRRAIFELKKLIEACKDDAIFLGVCGNQLVFSGESFNFFTKLLAEPFPAYAAVLEKNEFIPARIDRSSFVRTLRRSTSLLSGQFLATQFEFGSGKIHVAMNNKDVGTLDEEISVEGLSDTQINARFYAPYVLNGLQALPEDQVSFFIKSSTRPIIFESQEDDMLMTYLVMPVSPTTGV